VGNRADGIGEPDQGGWIDDHARLHEPSIWVARRLNPRLLLSCVGGQTARRGPRVGRLLGVGSLQAVSRMGMARYSSNADRIRLSRSFTFG
jgi:hypothetical protein